MGAEQGLEQQREQEYLTVVQTVRKFGIGRSTVYELVRQRKVKSRRVGVDVRSGRGRRLINAASMRKFIEGCPE